ncbi:hypothetical protein [Variovorax sp. J31P207]|uniref:hypothetical protein n=1 Tax=Variovorax sp. J31P207 TaxID=3053510 RepID=UPI0025785086|nr:hypothetical protein [Variovorax sp. J31P207]MDM0072519.1 hypothetical protein [Variovorax sp. J31P207]
MEKAFGLTIPRTLDDVCNPREMAQRSVLMFPISVSFNLMLSSFTQQLSKPLG